MSAYRDKDPRIHGIQSKIRVVADFPKPGIMFQDITTLLLDPKAFKDTVDLFVERYKGKNISVVAGIEARGFIFGSPIALEIGAKFVPLRKPKKLPAAPDASLFLPFRSPSFPQHQQQQHPMSPQQSHALNNSHAHLSSGLACGLAGLSAGMAIGIVGDASVRANAQQPKLFVGMILILIFC